MLEIKCEISCVIIDVRYLAKTDYDEQDILTTNELTFIQIVSNKGMMLSTLGVKVQGHTRQKRTPFPRDISRAVSQIVATAGMHVVQ